TDPSPVAHGLLLEELATLLGRGKWEGSTLIPFLTETFDTPPVYDVPFRKNPVHLLEPTPNLVAGTTPEWLWKSMREVDIHGGFGNRLFFLTGTPKDPIPMPGKPDAAVLDRVRQALDGLTTVPAGEMALSPDAQPIWHAFYRRLREKQKACDPLVAAMTKR